MTWWTAVFEPVWTVSLLPSNATAWERAVEAVDADLVARDPVGLIAASRGVDTVPEPWLAHLADERSVDDYSSAWPQARRKAVTSASFTVHQRKGTYPALVAALQALNLAVTATEWFEVQPQRQQSTFRVSVEIEPDREWLGCRGGIIDTVNKTKNLHTKLEAIEVRRSAGPATIYVGGHVRRTRTIRIGQLPTIGVIRTGAMVWLGCSQRHRRTLRVGPHIAGET